MEMRREGKEVGFQSEKININMFLLDIYKIYSRKNESKQNKHKLKDLELFKVLWTTY